MEEAADRIKYWQVSEQLARAEELQRYREVGGRWLLGG